MAEGFNDDAPVARGRRDPELEIALQAEQDLNDAGEDTEQDIVGLLPGDGIIAKVTLAVQTPMGDGWYTYGIQTRVADGESEEDTFIRTMDVVNNRVLNLAQDGFNKIETLQADLAEAPKPRGRITPR
jgi:hypothetical protein